MIAETGGSRATLLGPAEIDDRHHLANETVRRIACDAGTVTCGTVRTAPCSTSAGSDVRFRLPCAALSSGATAVADFPGCGLRFCDAHHIEHCADGGETKLDNVIQPCRFHHRSLHEGGYRLELSPEGEPRFVHQSGWLIPEVPPHPRLGDQPVHVIERENREAGLEIDGWTSCPDWSGELDVSLGHAR